MKKLFILQYSHELDQFQLTEVDNPQDIANFQIPIIDASHQSSIRLSSHLIDTEKIECSFPDAQIFANPHNKPTPLYSYGILYNWFAVSHPNFAPEGWHVPTDNEFQELIDYATVNATPGALKEAGIEHWITPNLGATNEFGFNALPAGLRGEEWGNFAGRTTLAMFWSATENDETFAWGRSLSYQNSTSNKMGSMKQQGASIRLLKNDSVNPGIISDIDGNQYQTTEINGQIWLAGNWKCTKFNDGSQIPNITSSTEWTALSTPAFAAYNNDWEQA